MSKRRLNSRLRIQFLGLFMLLGVGSLGVRLWWIQVAHGQEWTSQIRGSSQATVRIPSVRGEIKDRNGLTLVQNRASYEVDFYLPEMVKGYRERFGSPPTSEYRAIISGMPKDMKEPDIIKIVNNGIVPRLNELDLARDYNAGKLQRHFRNDTEVPFSYIKDIDFPTMAKFAEHDVGLPGVDLAIKPVRSYVYGALGSHILGYVGAPDDIDKEEAKKFTFYQADVGRKIEHRENDGRIFARETRHAVFAAQCEGHNRRDFARRSAATGRECFLDDRRPYPGHRRGSIAIRRPRRCRASSIQTTAKSSQWLRCHRSIQIPLFPASRQKIGRRSRRMKPIRSSIAR